MATVYTREWIQFFTGCGIPGDVAATYALIFYENRIQKNMLLDLNKEYLRDMGITVMGDVIAILRHAKQVYEKYVRAQIFSSVEENIIVEKNNLITESSPGVKKSTPLKRILEHYTRKYNSQDTEPINEVQETLPIDKITFSDTGGNKVGVQRPLKKKIQISTKSKDLKEKGLEVPVPKVRRVLPENEGGYKIKMPSGTTERSKKLLEQAKKRKAKTVFDRLGESSVSSTTSEISTSSATSSPLNKNPSVFSRLGEKTSVVSSTSSIEDTEIVPPDQLQYAGILKGVKKKNLPNTTMRADEQQQSQKNKVRKGISVKKRLGVTNPEESISQKRPMLKAVRRTAGETQTKTTIIKIPNKVNASQTGVKAMAGPVISKNFKADPLQSKTLTTTRTQGAKLLNLKRKMDDESDVSPLKKVRFGRTTHRLIPASPGTTDPVNYVKNYPKLTMIISNRTNSAENNTLSSGIKIGSLNSDNVSDRLGVKARIGNKSMQGRLGKRIRAPTQSTPRGSKLSTVKDRDDRIPVDEYCHIWLLISGNKCLSPRPPKWSFRLQIKTLNFGKLNTITEGHCVCIADDRMSEWRVVHE